MGEPLATPPKRWVVLIDPGCVPELKGPFPIEMIADFLRDVRLCRPSETKALLLGWEGTPSVQDAREWLAMCGYRPPKPIRRRLTSILRQGGDRTQAILSGRMVRIWSGEHSAYWRDNGQGFTDGKRIRAWVLPFEQALAETRHCGPEKQIVFEVAQ